MPERTVSESELSEIARLVAAEVLEKLQAELSSASPERVDAWSNLLDACACFTSEGN